MMQKETQKNRRESMLLIFAIFLSTLTLGGCSRISLNPCSSFEAVQQDVFCRSGQNLSCNEETTIDQWLKDPLTLDLAVRIALLNNPRLQAAYQELGVGHAELVQAGLLNNPVFGFSRRIEEFNGPPFLLEMGLFQNFLDILLKPRKVKLARSQLRQIRDEITTFVVDMIADTQAAYYSLQINEQILSEREQFLEAAESKYDVAHRLYEAGNITDLDLALHKMEFEQAKVDTITFRVNVEQARERLNVLMGICQEANSWKISPDPLKIPDASMDVSDLEELAISNSLPLQIARESMRSTALSYGIKTFETTFSEFTAGINSEHESGSLWLVGPEFSLAIPIFDLGHAQRAAARAELMKKWNEYIAMCSEIRSSARLAAFRLKAAKEQSFQTQNTLTPLSEEITSKTLLQLNAMQLGAIDLLQTKQMEIETKIKEALYRQKYWMGVVEINRLLSGGRIK